MQCTIFRDSTKNNADRNKIISLGKYQPKYNPKFDSFSRSVLQIKHYNPSESDIIYFVNELRAIFSDTEKYVICVIQKHIIGTAPSGIRTIAKRLCKTPIIDGTDVIVRVNEIPKKALGGKRDLKSEIESLTLKNEIIIKYQQVLLLDDVTTTGISLRAGKYMLENTGAKIVVMYALGLTQFI
ncbi:Uncharacterised protein [uncultured archaeon]|nr:Uncharacterised protein [uncultured archaeon]